MNIPALKDKFLDSLDLWLEERVDDMLKDNAAMAIPAVYSREVAIISSTSMKER